MKFITRNWIAILLCTLSFGCATPAEKPGHNDPSKYTLAPNVLWASPDGFDLSMDIYTLASGKDSYPVLMIFHGGGWLINDKSIMDQAAKYFATNSEYVVCNVDYRLLGDQDNTVTIDQIDPIAILVHTVTGNFRGAWVNISVKVIAIVAATCTPVKTIPIHIRQILTITVLIDAIVG